MLFEKHREILVWNGKGKKQRNLGPTWRAICKVFSVTVVCREYWVLKIIVICPISNYLSGLVTTGFGRAFHLISNRRLQSPVLSNLLVAHWPKKRSVRITWHLLSRQGGRRILSDILRRTKGELSVHISLALFVSVWFGVFFCTVRSSWNQVKMQKSELSWKKTQNISSFLCYGILMSKKGGLCSGSEVDPTLLAQILLL